MSGRRKIELEPPDAAPELVVRGLVGPCRAGVGGALLRAETDASVCVAEREEEVLGKCGLEAEAEAAIDGGRGIVSSVLRKRLISSPSPGLDEDV